MVVTMSRRIAVDLYREIAALRPEWVGTGDDDGALKVVMTGSASDPVDWQDHIRNKPRREALAARFRNPGDPFQVVIVRDMWLTGFDAPSLHTMYLDKPMRGHGLMQAIARVNRVFRDKPGGLVGAGRWSAGSTWRARAGSSRRSPTRRPARGRGRLNRVCRIAPAGRRVWHARSRPLPPHPARARRDLHHPDSGGLGAEQDARAMALREPALRSRGVARWAPVRVRKQWCPRARCRGPRDGVQRRLPHPRLGHDDPRRAAAPRVPADRGAPARGRAPDAGAGAGGRGGAGGSTARAATELVAHLDFAERRLDAADPLGNPDLLLPRVQAPKPDDLKPYLDGWSPHGPDEGRW